MRGPSLPAAFLLPVFAVGGSGVKQASLSLRASGMLAKPFTPSDEISKVQSLGFMLDPNSTTSKLCDLDQGISLNLSFLICKMRQ